MAFPTMPDICPSFGTAKTMQPRMLRAEFGNGYSQRVKDGLNTTLQKWRVVWNNIPKADANTLDAFFEARGAAEPFMWEPIGEETERVFVCETWTKTPVTGGFTNLTADFREEADPPEP